MTRDDSGSRYYGVGLQRDSQIAISLAPERTPGVAERPARLGNPRGYPAFRVFDSDEAMHDEFASTVSGSQHLIMS